MSQKAEKFPLVSCLCLTKNKLDLLGRAIDCFMAQTYPNKELILLKQGGSSAEIKNYLKKLKAPNITFIMLPPEPNYSLGELRNISMQRAKGAYTCQWDDDDWYHCDRISIQLDAAIKNDHPVTMLSNEIIFDDTTKKAWFSSLRTWENTVLCKKDILNENIKYPSVARSEDTMFLDSLLLESRVYTVIAPNLYIYVYHGNNTWNQEHFTKRIFPFAQELSIKTSKLISDILNNKYSVVEASALLNSEVFLKELNYFEFKKKMLEAQLYYFRKDASVVTAIKRI